MAKKRLSRTRKNSSPRLKHLELWNSHFRQAAHDMRERKVATPRKERRQADAASTSTSVGGREFLRRKAPSACAEKRADTDENSSMAKLGLVLRRGQRKCKKKRRIRSPSIAEKTHINHASSSSSFSGSSSQLRNFSGDKSFSSLPQGNVRSRTRSSTPNLITKT